MKTSTADVIYASRMKPGDLYTGKVNLDAPTRPVQTFAVAHRLTEVTPYTGLDGAKMLRLEAGSFTLTPIRVAAQVLVIREGEPTPDQVARYLAQHREPTHVPASAAGRLPAVRNQLAELQAAARLVVDAWDHGGLAAAVSTLADFLPEDDRCAACRVPGHDQCGTDANCPCCDDSRREREAH